MLYGENTNVLCTKKKARKTRETLSFIVLGLLILSIAYFAYWVVAMSDRVVLEYTEQYFAPLANLLVPNVDTIDIYRQTGVRLFLACIPCSLLFGIIDFFESIAIKFHFGTEEQQIKRAQQKEYDAWNKQYDKLTQYSICLSLDYESQKKLSFEARQTLTKIAFNKIRADLKAKHRDITIYTGKALVITSKNFAGYDSVYSNLLRCLAEIKRKYETAYKLNFIPSTTTEAFDSKEGSKIEENHFKIQSCNFKNRACATNDFAKKYTHLRHEKYAGIPIGDFVIFENNVPKTYELNIIYKNLSDSLTKIAV